MCVEKRSALWDELEKQKALLEAQEDRVCQQLKLLADAVMAGQITDWPEVEDLIFELIEFGDYYRPAWELNTQLRKYVEQHYSSYVEIGGNITRVFIPGDANGE